jgi:arylsulfatase
MKTPFYLHCFAILSLYLPLNLFSQSKPNIVVVLVDDMGYSDLGCYGGEIPTPNIDQLAKDGLRFTNFYNAARCCPSRAALLTGVYPHQAGIGHMMEDKGEEHPAYRGHLNKQTITIGELLKSAGYFTIMTGKWHVGQPKGVTPANRGFDRSLNAPAGGFYYGDHQNARLFLNGQRIQNDSPELPKNWYSTDLWTEFGLKFIDQAVEEKKPFLLYLAHNAPHFPLQAPLEEIEKFRGKYREGWEKFRERRYQKQIELGLIDPSWKLPPFNPNVPKWDSLSEQEKDKYDHLMAIYAAVVSRLDKSIGDLVKGLKEKGVYDNTVILFVSDNGGNPEPSAEGRYQGENPGDSKSSIFLGQGWAEVGCTPFWSYKHHTHEGGISTAGIVSWPNGIKSDKKGTFIKETAHITDILATVADFAGASYPETYNENKITPTVGVSLKPLIEGKKLNRTKPVYWEHEGNKAILLDEWKLVAENEENWHLYNLKNDRTELKNVIEDNPKIANKLKDLYQDWYKKINAEPWEGNPVWFYDYEKAKEENARN